MRTVRFSVQVQKTLAEIGPLPKARAASTESCRLRVAAGPYPANLHKRVRTLSRHQRQTCVGNNPYRAFQFSVAAPSRESNAVWESAKPRDKSAGDPR